MSLAEDVSQPALASPQCPKASSGDVNRHVIAGPNARETVRRDQHSDHASRGVGRRVVRAALRQMREAGGADLGGAAKTRREEPTGFPVRDHESGRAVESGEIRIVGGVGAEVQLPLGETKTGRIPVGDRPEAIREVTVEKLVALLNKIAEDIWGLLVVPPRSTPRKPKVEPPIGSLLNHWTNP